MKTTGSFRFADIASIPAGRHRHALFAVMLWLGATLQPANAAVEWRQDFEGDTSTWTIEGGVWAVGLPSGTGAPTPFGGTKVAATTLTGNYPSTSDARLISPEFVVPAAAEAPRLAYHYWYQIGLNDNAQLQIRPSGGAWQDLAGGRLTETAGAGGWARHSVDLRAFEGQTVQVGFRLVSAFNNSAGDHALGWYVDDVGVETGAMTANLPEGFESGFGDWSVEGGIWQRGVATGTGAPPLFAGGSGVGTILTGNYGRTHDARLITPEFVVPPAGEAPRFGFHYWYQLGANDYGQVQIRTPGGAWQDVAGGRLVETAGTGGWTRQSIDLRAYAGQTVQLAFRLVTAFTNVAGDYARGWYLDEAGLQSGPMLLASPEGFESGFGDWSVEGGVWQRGTPTGAGAPSVFTGSSVVGTILSGNYGANLDARLITPEFTVPAAGEAPRFTYHYWYQIGGQDYAQLQIRTAGGAWQDITGERLVDATVGRWSRRSVDLRTFAGQNVQLAFRLVTVFENRAGDFALGWYVDEAGIETGPMQLGAPEGFENGFGDWSAEGGLWQVGPPSGAGSPTPFAGANIAGTIVAGTYGGVHDARLVTPEFAVPAAVQQPRFSFYHWFNLGTLDYAQLQVRIVGGVWQDIGGERLTQTGLVWIRRSVDLRAYAGQNVQLGFRIVTDYENRANDIQLGWYIDEAQLETGPMQFATPEGFENGFGDWSSEGGVWQIGAPTAVGGPAVYEGVSVAGTILAGNYPLLANARLVSPEFVVPPASRAPQLSFQHWRLMQGNDTGRVEVSVSGGAWSPVSPVVSGSAASWQRMALDITPYGGQPVRVAWRFNSDNSFVQLGWYVDDVQLGTLDPLVLTPGVNANGTLAATGARALYVIEVPPGGHLRFTLEDLDNLGANEVYVRRGALPTAGAYDYRFTTTGPDQSVFVPNAGAGPWLVLIVGGTVPPGGSAYQIRADLSQGIGLASVAPTRFGNGSPAVIDVAGAGFDDSAVVELRSGATVLNTADVNLISGDKLRAYFSLGGVAPGIYQVAVTQGTTTLTLPIEVVAGGLPKLEAQLIVPARVGRHASATLFVEYANTGEVGMAAPILVVRGSENPLLTLDSSIGAQGLWTASQPRGYNDTVQILASGATPGILQPGERRRVPVYYSGLQQPWSFSRAEVEFELGVFDAADTSPIDWNGFKSAVRPPTMGTDAWDAVTGNVISTIGNTWGGYAAVIADNALYLGKLGLNLTNVAELLTFEFAQAGGLNPVGALASATDASVRQPGMSLVFGRVFPQPLTQRFRLGPLGRGWAHNWEFRSQVDAQGNVNVTGPGGAQRLFQRSLRGGYFAQTGDYGRLLSLGAGRYQLTEKDGNKMVFRADGWFDFLEDLNGNRITATYSAGVLASLTHSAGLSLQLAYSGGRLQSVTDPYGRVVNYTYNGEHLSGVTTYGTSTVSYGYVTGQGAARQHALATITYPDGKHDEFTYDTQGRLTALSRGCCDEEFQFAYDSAGMVTVADASQNATRFYFEHRGLVARVEDPSGNASRFGFDRNLNLTSVQAPDGRATTLSYDAAGNLTRVLDPLGQAVNLKIGANTRLAQLTDARGQTTAFTYNAQGNASEVIYPGGSKTTFTANSQGEVMSAMNRRGQTITLTRDAAGRVTRKVLPEGRTVDFTYDTRGNLSLADDSTQGATSLQHDARDRLIAVTYPDGRGFQFEYDDAGRRTRRTSHDGHMLNYVYDTVGRLERLEDGAQLVLVEYLYDAQGRLSRENKGNDTWTTYHYDAAGQLASLVNHAAGGGVVSQFDYTYDAAGRRTTKTDTAGSHGYAYDANGQLTGVQRPDGSQVSYSYDAAGNRTAVNDDGVNTPYTVNQLNQYGQVGTATLVHDADGNLISRTDPAGTTTYQYDSESRLISVTTPAAGVWQYAYDAFGHLSSVTHDGQVTHYLLDPSGLVNVAAEYDGAGNLVARYEHGLGLVSRTDPLGNAAFYNYDALGSASELTDDLGAVVNEYAFDEFGSTLQKTETVPNPFAFVGRFGVLDAGGGLLHMRARAYRPDLGRFAQIDPLGLLAELNPTSYQYAANDPVSLIDPLGLNPLSPFDEVFTDSPQTTSIMQQGEQAGWVFSLGEVIASFGGNADGAKAFGAVGLAWGFRDAVLFYNRGDGRRAAYEYAKAFTTAIPGLLVNRLCAGPCEAMVGGVIGLYSGMVYDAATDLIGYTIMYGWMSYDWFSDNVTWYNIQKLAGKIVAAFDPNEMIGPAGFGEANYLKGDGPFAYRINFENAAAATAPAQVVEIANTLDPNLDLATLEFTSVGFGDLVIPVPGGSQHFEHTERVTYNGVEFDVVIEARLDHVTRQVLVKFDSILPDTGLPPEVEVGFLPPEDGTFRGQGHAAYVITPVADLPTDTEIRNIGLITFDPLAGGPTFRTDLTDPYDPNSAPNPARQALVTIDADGPSSAVTALPNELAGPNFVVAWSGTDAGAGIATFDVYVQTDGGAWVLWLDDTDENSVLWQGEHERSYGFFSVATDGVGFSEAPPGPGTVAQTTTITLPRTNFFRVISTGQAVNLEFVGTPGEQWLVQRAPFVNGPWDNRGPITIQPGGSAPFTDSNPLPGQAYYQAVKP